jgi:hypothetical protein
VYSEEGTYQWVEVPQANNSDFSLGYLTTLCQVLQADLGQDPFFATYGIPTIKSLQTGVPPNLYVARTQAQFAPFFARLSIVYSTGTDGAPIYSITAVTFSGAVFTLSGFSSPVIPT